MSITHQNAPRAERTKVVVRSNVSPENIKLPEGMSLPEKPQASSPVPPMTPEKAPEKPSEPPQQEKTPEPIPSPKEDLDTRIQGLLKREAALVARDRELKEKENNFKGKLSKEEWAEQFRKDPSQLGFTDEDLARLFLGQGQEEPSESPSPSKEVLELREEIASLKSLMEDNQKTSYSNAKKALLNDVGALVQQDETGDSFGLIKAAGAEQAVVDYIEQVYKDEGELLSVQDAASEVEAYLNEQALAFAKVGKVQKALSPQTPPAQIVQSNGQKTLTHSLKQQSGSWKSLDSVTRARLVAQYGPEIAQHWENNNQ